MVYINPKIFLFARLQFEIISNVVPYVKYLLFK